MNIFALKAFSDNYIWTIPSQDDCEVIVVDPGEAQPVENYLKQHQATLHAILITHHHYDHTNGANHLAKKYGVAVYGPSLEAQSVVTHPLREGDEISFPTFALNYRILDIPGHTLGHIAYVGEDHCFTGDTLFAAGCGRVFEGTNAQMLASLRKLAALPPDIKIYCGHEYTLANLEFAQAVEPNNSDIRQRLTKVRAERANGENTLPSTIALELATNPFLRVSEQGVKTAAEQQLGSGIGHLDEVFGTIRAWKNRLP